MIYLSCFIACQVLQERHSVRGRGGGPHLHPHLHPDLPPRRGHGVPGALLPLPLLRPHRGPPQHPDQPRALTVLLPAAALPHPRRQQRAPAHHLHPGLSRGAQGQDLYRAERKVGFRP